MVPLVTACIMCLHVLWMLQALSCSHAAHVTWSLVVDNILPTNRLAVLSEAAAESRVPIVHLHEPRQGKSFALNRGLAVARGDVIALTDDDVLPATDWLAGIVRRLPRARRDVRVRQGAAAMGRGAAAGTATARGAGHLGSAGDCRLRRRRRSTTAVKTLASGFRSARTSRSARLGPAHDRWLADRPRQGEQHADLWRGSRDLHATPPARPVRRLLRSG